MSLIRFSLLLIFLLPGLAEAKPQNYIVADTWQAEDGLPLDTANSLAIDPHGRVWISTLDGLARFDGFDFTLFTTESSPPLPSNRVLRVLALGDDAVVVQFEGDDFGILTGTGYRAVGNTAMRNLHVDDGAIWFLEDSRLVQWRARDGKVQSLASLNGRSLQPDPERSRWLIGTEDGAVHAHWPADSQTRQLVSGLDGPVVAISPAPDGSLAVATEHGITHLDSTELEPGPFFPFPSRQWFGLGLEWTPRGWISTGVGSGPFDRLNRFDARSLAPIDETRSGFSPIRLTRTDAQGRFWENHGVRLIRDGELVFESPDPILDFAFDRYGQVWIATLLGGLQRLTEPSLETVGHGPDQMSDPNTYALYHHDGQLLVGSLTALYSHDLDSGQWRKMLDQRATGLLPDNGTVLVGGNGLCRLEAPGLCPMLPVLAEPFPVVNMIHRDDANAVWLGTGSGLYRRTPDGNWEGPSLTRATVRAGLETADGLLLFATRAHGVIRAWRDRPDQPPEIYLDRKSGLASNHVRSFLEVNESEILIGLEDRGICLYRRGQGIRRCISSDDGLPHHSVHRMIADFRGRIWVNTNNGIYTVELGQLMSFLHGESANLTTRAFGVVDGMASSEGNGGMHSSGIRTPDGRIWFPNQRGIVVIDPEQIELETYPLNAHIRAPGFEIDDPIVLPPERRVLRVRLGAIALRGADRVQFRYRLNDEAGWSEVGNQSELAFESLSPGRYYLEVGARYLGGEWTGETAVLAFSVPPRLAERRSFWIAAVIIVLALLGGLWLRERAHSTSLEDTVALRTAALRDALETVESQARSIREAAERRKEVFLTISHELRTPLTLIHGPLHDQQHSPDPQQLDRMRRSAENMRRMIDQILDLERQELDQPPQMFAEDLRSLLRRSVEMHLPAMEQKGITLNAPDLELPATLMVEADASQLEHALSIIVGNAVKYAGDGGQVGIRVDHDAELQRVRVEIHDSGPGIPEDERDQVFEPFVRGSQASQPGLGLGLAICKRILDQHNGRVAIDSGDLGGACVTVTLPASSQSVSPEVRVVAETGQLILIVDDNPDIRAHVRDLLPDNYRVIEAGDAFVGERIALRELPDLLIVDISMPGRTGLELVERLRKRDESAAIPVLFFTAHASTENEVRSFKAGGDQFLEKPFAREQLVSRIERMLSAHEHLIDQLRRQAGQVGPSGRLATRLTFADRVRQSMLDRIDDPDLDVDQLAQLMGTSRASLYRKLEEALELSPAEYLRNLRLDQAARLLRETNARVSEIAYAVGFRRLSTFTRSFRAHFGLAPTAYRRKAENEGEPAPED